MLHTNEKVQITSLGRVCLLRPNRKPVLTLIWLSMDQCWTDVTLSWPGKINGHRPPVQSAAWAIRHWEIRADLCLQHEAIKVCHSYKPTRNGKNKHQWWDWSQTPNWGCFPTEWCFPKGQLLLPLNEISSHKLFHQFQWICLWSTIHEGLPTAGDDRKWFDWAHNV